MKTGNRASRGLKLQWCRSTLTGAYMLLWRLEALDGPSVLEICLRRGNDRLHAHAGLASRGLAPERGGLRQTGSPDHSVSYSGIQSNLLQGELVWEEPGNPRVCGWVGSFFSAGRVQKFSPVVRGLMTDLFLNDVQRQWLVGMCFITLTGCTTCAWGLGVSPPKSP